MTTPEPRPDAPAPLSAPEAILRRRSTRHFDPARPVPDRLLGHVLHLATRAPSGFNLQPWRFLVVRSRRNRERLRACAFGQAKLGEAPVVVILLGYWNPHRSDLDAMLAEALRLGATDAEGAAAWRASARRNLERQADRTLWATRWTMVAAANLMIAAEALGLASAPVEGFDEARLRAAFGVPDDHAVCGLVALGYPAGPTPFPGRFDLDYVTYAEHFGQPLTLDEPDPADRPLDSPGGGE